MAEQNNKPVRPANPAGTGKPAVQKRSAGPVKEARPSKPVKQEEPEDTNRSEQEVSETPEKKKPGISRFTKGLIIWLVVLTAAICIGLIWFNSFLGRYEELYQSSLPYHQAESTMKLFADQDLDSIWNLINEKPKISEFENDATLKKYMKNIIKGKEFTYKQTEDYAENAPEYYICTDKHIIAKLKLAEDETNPLPYGFKSWKAGDLEFYTAADYNLKLTLPETYKLTVNGREVPAEYKTEQGIDPEQNKYLKPYAELPKQCVYEIKGLYEEPVIKISDSDGKEVKAQIDKSSGEYKVGYSAECPDKEAAEKFAISFTKDFANYISQDAGNYALDKYFPKNSKTLRDIKRNSSREWYTRHGKVDIKNEQVKEFKCFAKDIVYVEAYVEQHMEMFWGSKEREVVKTTAHLYLCKIDGKWKVAGIKY
jgi:hypothetical protein